MKLPREFYIPKGSVKVADKLSDAVAYVYTNAGGKPCAQVFFGKQNKPVVHFSYRNNAAREKSVTDAFASRRAHIARVAQNRADEKSFKHAVQVGDIFSTCWGYDQTNVEFFEVTKLIGSKMCELREIACAADERGGPQERVVPQSGAYLSPRYDGDDRGQPIRRLIQRDTTGMPISKSTTFAAPPPGANASPVSSSARQPREPEQAGGTDHNRTPPLAELGEALYGPQWQAPLARALSVNLRTMQRWAAGTGAPSDTVIQDIANLLRDRYVQIARLRNRLGR